MRVICQYIIINYTNIYKAISCRYMKC